jgi:hypothetical protein
MVGRMGAKVNQPRVRPVVDVAAAETYAPGGGRRRSSSFFVSWGNVGAPRGRPSWGEGRIAGEYLARPWRVVRSPEVSAPPAWSTSRFIFVVCVDFVLQRVGLRVGPGPGGGRGRAPPTPGAPPSPSPACLQPWRLPELGMVIGRSPPAPNNPLDGRSDFPDNSSRRERSGPPPRHHRGLAHGDGGPTIAVNAKVIPRRPSSGSWSLTDRPLLPE